MRRQGVRRTAVLALVVGVLLSLAGCGKASVAMTVHKDDTVTMVARLQLSTALLAQAGTDIDTVVDQALPKTWAVASRERYVDGEDTGVQVTMQPMPLSAVAAGGVRIQHVNHLYVLNGVVDTSATRSNAGPGTFSLSVTFPGDVQQTNGHRAGRTVTWSGQAGDVLQVRAVADDDFFYQLGERVGVFTVYGITAALLLAILVIAVTDRRRRPAVRPAYAAPPAVPTPSGPWTGPASWTPDTTGSPVQPPRPEPQPGSVGRGGPSGW